MVRLISWITPTAAWVVAATAFGQGEPFTYQGQLKRQGSPLTTDVDMRFSLYDSDTADTPLAGPLVFDGQSGNAAAVPATNGLFSVELDFGMDALLQGGRWIQIELRAPHDPTDSEPYTPLTPRQRITAAPFAMSVPGLAASDAGVNVSGDIHAVGEVVASAFSSNSPLIFKVNPANVECARFDDANCYFGLGTPVPQARLHVGGVAGVDGIMFPDGSMQTTAAGLGGGDGFWSPNGSNIFSNNGGNVGIGRTNPTFKLDVNASNSFGARIGMQAAGGGALVVASNPGDNRVYLEGYNSTDNGSATEMLITGYAGGVLPQLTISADKVGIGTGTPAAKLDIAASGEGAELLRFSTERPWVFRQVYTGSSAGLQLYSTVGLKSFEITASGGTNVATFFANDADPRVGIGTTIPLAKLDITGSGEGIDLLRFSTERPWVFRQVRTGPSAGLQLLSTTGQKAFEITANDGNNVATFVADSVSSRVGIGTTNPAAKLDVVGNTGDAIRGIHAGSTATAAMHAVSLTFDGNGVIGEADVGGSAFGVWGRSANGIGGYFTGGTYALIADGRARVDILEIAGADVAEKFLSSDDNVEPGTVMEIDPGHPGQLRVTREAYSSRVAGVVSGAGDIPMGAVLGNLPGHENAPPIALSGRVWVRCDASQMAIAPGDMLTTSDTAGHAMKAADRGRAFGTILGKSMTALAKGERGLVLVLVNLQ